MSEPGAGPSPADPVRDEVVKLAGFGVDAATVAAAVGLGLAEFTAQYGKLYQAERAKAVALVGRSLVQRAIKGEGKEAIAAAQAFLREQRAASAAPAALPEPAAAAVPEAEQGDLGDLQPEPAPTPTVIVNLEQMAERLRVSLPTMRRLVRRYPDLPVVERGSNGVPWAFDLAAVVDFVRRKREEEAASRSERDELLAQISLPLDQAAPADQAAMKPADLLAAWRAKKLHHEMAKEAGELVWKSHVRQAIANECVALGRFLQTVPAQVMRRCGIPDPVIREVQAGMLEQLREFRRKRQRDGLVLEADEEEEAEADDNAA